MAARTTSLRVGSGGVMLPNYAPLAVVEQVGMLEDAARSDQMIETGRVRGKLVSRLRSFPLE